MRQEEEETGRYRIKKENEFSINIYVLELWKISEPFGQAESHQKSNSVI